MGGRGNLRQEEEEALAVRLEIYHHLDVRVDLIPQEYPTTTASFVIFPQLLRESDEDNMSPILIIPMNISGSSSRK